MILKIFLQNVPDQSITLYDIENWPIKIGMDVTKMDKIVKIKVRFSVCYFFCFKGKKKGSLISII